MMRFALLSIFTCLIALERSEGRTEMNGIAWPSLSPDGKMVAFEWLNDLWVAPSDGGAAVRIVGDGSRDAYPKFTPDGKRIVFSSERSGSAQVYSVNLEGTDLRQHSDHSEGNVLEAVSPDGKYAISRGIRSSAGYKPNRLMKIDLRNRSRELELFDMSAHSALISPDGKQLLFCSGGEQLYRSGYRGSRASKIHLFDFETKGFKTLVDSEWEARSPMWNADGSGFYYVSNVTGDFNLWEWNSGDESSTQLTFFEGQPIVIPTLSMDGSVMLFRAGGKVLRWEMAGDAKPREVAFFTEEKIRTSPVRRERVGGTSSVVFPDDGERIIFSAAGDLWSMDREDDQPNRLTETDSHDERELVMGSDGTSIFYLKDDGVVCQIIRSGWNEDGLENQEVLVSNSKSKRSLRISPGGKWLSWLEATGNLVTMEISKGTWKVVMPCWDVPTYDWAPDEKWLVLAAKDLHSNRDIWIVPADGSKDALNLTKHPAFEGSPKWSPDGSKIVFTSRRDTDQTARLWIAELGKNFSESSFDSDAFGKVSESIKKLDTADMEPYRVMWSADSDSVLFQSRDRSEKTVFSYKLDEAKIDKFGDFRGIPEGRGSDDKTLWRMDRVPAVFNGAEPERFEFSFSVEQDRSKRLRLGFRKIWRTLAERFYDPSMNATDWNSILVKYENAASEALDSRQFDRVVAQMLGDLNASHLTFKTKPWGPGLKENEMEAHTGYPGIEFESSWDGQLVVKRVLDGAPVSTGDDAPKVGEIVRRIGGSDVDAKTPLTKFFNGMIDRSVPMVLEDSEGNRRTLEVLPISYETARSLDRESKNAKARKSADRYGLAYFPFRQMKSSSLEELSVEIYRSSLESEGLILDLRNNAGGRAADELLAIFCQPVHSFTLPRNGPVGYPTDRRIAPSWAGPMVVLCNENTYSNAEIFCHAFKMLERGKLVGMPTNGGVISAVGVTIPEVGELQIPFRGWFHAETGVDLELNGAKPDIIVPIALEEQDSNEDPQLRAAIEALKVEIKAASEHPEAIYKSQRD